MTAPNISETDDATEVRYSGGMIALVPENPGALVVSGGDPEEQLHLTLAYLGDDVLELPEEILDGLRGLGAMIAQETQPIVGRIFAHSRWNPDGGPDGDREPVAVYEIDNTPSLNSLQDRVCWQARELMGEALFPEQHHPFKAHVTAGYGLEPSALTATGEVRFTHLRVALGGEVNDYPLAGREWDYEVYTAKTVTAAAVETAEAAGIPELDNGTPVTFPVIIVEGMETSDGRFIEAGALGHRALPLPILAQSRNPDGGGGHDGAEVIGRLDTLTRTPGPQVIDKETGEPFPEGVFVWSGTGFIDPEHPASTLVRKGYLTGNSADLSDVEAEFVFDNEEDEDDFFAQPSQIRMTAGKIAATTLVPIPAFAQAYIQLDDETIEPNEEALAASAAPAWVAAEVGDDCFLCAAGIPNGFEKANLVASTAPVEQMLPPLEMFTDPGLTEPTPLTILDAEAGFGYLEVVGHLAAWNTCHTGFAGQCVTAPKSRHDYGYFNVGAVRTFAEDGSVVTVAAGHITMGEGGHAGIKLSPTEAAEHYDNINTVVADVTAGEDEFGIWVHGVVRRTATPEQVDALRASPLSGDWRSIDGSLELVAALAVNSGGFPIPRARVASGAPTALVAAGVVPQPEKEAPVATGAVVLDYDTLADAIADRLDAKRANADRELSLRAQAARLRLGF